MPSRTRHNTQPRPMSMASFTVSKRLYLHEAKFPKGAETGFSKSPLRPTRSVRNVSYAESDEEEEPDEEEYDEIQDEQQVSEADHDSIADSDSDIEEISSAAFEASVRPATNCPAQGTGSDVDSASGKLFKDLATEIHQLIAGHLDADHDIASYALTCRTTGASITQSVWRQRFQRTFDFDDKLSTAEMLLKYKYRRLVSRQWTCFDLDRFGSVGHSYEVQKVQDLNQEHCLAMLRSLIIDSNGHLTVDEEGLPIVNGLNLQFIRDMITGDHGMSYIDIIDSVFNTKYDDDIGRGKHVIMNTSDTESTLHNVQLCLAAFSLHPKYANMKVPHFDISQYQVYSAPTHQPLFLDKWKQSVNTKWLLHVVNFFKFHFKSEGDGLLSHVYSDLDHDQYPQPWVGKIPAGTQALATHWKGAYMYIDHDTLLRCRSTKPSGSNVYTDALDGGETFQDISFFFDDEQFGKDKWPAQWEQLLDSDPFKDLDTPRRRGRTSPRIPQEDRPEVKQFWGTCRGNKIGHFFGRLHAMAPQAGIHGYQRITMMKFYTKLEGGEHVYDPLQVWAYEGCVLPGGRLIVGRWWDAAHDLADDQINSGPFIWWNVDRGAAARPIGKNEAFNFLDTFQDHDVGVF